MPLGVVVRTGRRGTVPIRATRLAGATWLRRRSSARGRWSGATARAASSGASRSSSGAATRSSSPARTARENDAPAPARRPCSPLARDDRRRARPGAPRVRRPRAARLSRAHGPREPRSLRPPVPRAGAAGADRHAPRAIRAVGRARRARLGVLTGDDAAACAVSRASARAGAARPRRAAFRARHPGGDAPRPGARGARGAQHPCRDDTRAGAAGAAGDRRLALGAA